MLLSKVACNTLITETRTRTAHTEAGATDIISFKVCNSPGKMVAAIDSSGGPLGVHRRMERARV